MAAAPQGVQGPTTSAPKEIRLMEKMMGSTSLDHYRQVLKVPSMEDAARMQEASSPTSPTRANWHSAIDQVVSSTKEELKSRKNRTPKEVILEMQRGNGRFWMGLAQRPEMNAMQRRALIIAQAPSVAILGCADSRVPVEIVFDQGLGDIFTVRVAGNILDDAAHGSVEYAAKHLGVKVILVLGHEGCGAVRGAMSMSEASLAAEPENLRNLLNKIKQNLPLERIAQISDHRARDREAVVVNCMAQVKALQENPLIASRVQEGSLMVCGAFYEITSGIVDFFTLDSNGLVHDI